MSLLHLCKSLVSPPARQLPADHKLGPRLVCPEYSKSVQDVKTYPLLMDDKIFALCWHFDGTQKLQATMFPSPKPFCYHFHFDKDLKTQLHTHEYIELTYVADGEFKQRILGKDITFSKGELCLIDQNCLHQDYLTNQIATILFLGIANDMFVEIMSENITTEKIYAFLQAALMKQKDVQQYLHFKPGTESTDAMEDCLYLLIRELCDAGAGTRYIRKGLLLRIFRILSSKYEFALSKEQKNTMNWLMFEEITNYIKQHFASISIQELCHVFNFQEDYFNRLIKSKTGMTYSAYVQDLRIQRAEYLLINTNKSIEEIAEIVGYQNRGFFYKLFNKKHKMTPAQFRRI